MSSILQQIKSNTITELHIDDKDDDMIDGINDLIDALEKNTSIESIRLDGYLGCLRGDNRSTLIELIGGLPNLHQVHITHSLLMTKVLTLMISKANELRVLKLNEIVFQGVEEDMADCEFALLTHSCLKQFDLMDCSVAAVGNVSLDKLERAGKNLSVVTAEGSPEDANPVGAQVA